MPSNQTTEQRIEALEEHIKTLRASMDEARDDIASFIDAFKADAEDQYEQWRDELEDEWDEAQDRSAALWRRGKRGARKAFRASKHYTQEHPWQVAGSSLLILGLIGAVCYAISERSNSQFDALKRQYRRYF